jgi:hypothetical protein
VEVAEYAVSMRYVSEPAFAWWVPYTIEKRDKVIKVLKRQYFRHFQKYGIELPKTVKRALEIDEQTNTTFWRDAIKKEVSAVGKAFEILEEGAPNPVGHTLIDNHMVFDVKPDFTRKARLVAGRHMTDPPSAITYASVVSRESVRITFLLAALNDLNVLAADIGNAYLNARTREKVYTICEREFGDGNVGKKAIVVRAIYCLKSSGAAWRACLAEVLRDELGFKACRADNDVWLRSAQKPDGARYYEYVLFTLTTLFVYLVTRMQFLRIWTSISSYSSMVPLDHPLGTLEPQWESTSYPMGMNVGTWDQISMLRKPLGMSALGWNKGI